MHDGGGGGGVAMERGERRECWREGVTMNDRRRGMGQEGRMKRGRDQVRCRGIEWQRYKDQQKEGDGW